MFLNKMLKIQKKHKCHKTILLNDNRIYIKYNCFKTNDN